MASRTTRPAICSAFSAGHPLGAVLRTPKQGKRTSAEEILMRSALSWRHVVGLFVVVVIAAIGGSSARADGVSSCAEIVGGDGTCYTTIQAAIVAATAGQTILVGPGTYSGTVTVDKSVTIEGAQHGVDARTRSASDESVVAWTGSGNGAFAVFADN